ncbi:MAG: methyltransferase domain-containing protein [Candidatus Levyibacteriota bacterium]|nr:MAG: methyltransferase domain-containing protein [Candidatus Levybacteria bacterium]
MKNSLLINAILQKEIDPAFRRRAEVVIKNLSLKNGDKILEVGCGRGFYGHIIGTFFPKISYIGIDINEKHLRIAKVFAQAPNVNFRKVDATKLPFDDKVFDKIICTEVLEHIKNDRLAISELYRVIKPHGAAIITVPNKNYPFFWDPINWVLERFFHTHIPSHVLWFAGIWAYHVRLYGEDELLEKIKKQGFKVSSITRTTHFCFPFAHFLLGIGKIIVEKGFFTSFDRFAPSGKNSFLLKLVLKMFYLFDKYNDMKTLKKGSSFVNIIIKVKA